MFEYLPASHPAPVIEAKEMNDAGRTTSVESREEKPNPFSTRFPKFWVPLFGIWVKRDIEKMNQVFGSRTASIACPGTKPCFAVPVPEAATLRCAIFRSSGVKKDALSIESGRNKNKAIPHKNVASPRTMNIHCHGWRGCLTWPSP